MCGDLDAALSFLMLINLELSSLINSSIRLVLRKDHPIQTAYQRKRKNEHGLDKTRRQDMAFCFHALISLTMLTFETS